MKTLSHNTTGTHEDRENKQAGRRNKMKTLSLVAVVLAMAAAANAAIVTDPGLGALQIKLTYYPDGSATLGNVTGSTVNVDAYEIWSATNKLDQGDLWVPPYTHGWKSLADWNTLDVGTLVAALGHPNARFFTEMSATSHFLAEAALSPDPQNVPAYAAFQPGAPFSIGAPIQNTVPPVSDLTFYYTKPGVPGDKFLGLVELIPEPVTMGLLGLGAVGILIRRKPRA